MCSITGESNTLSITGAGAAWAACEDHITSTVSSQSEEQECPRFAPRSARGRVPERSLDSFPQSASGFEGSARAQFVQRCVVAHAQHRKEKDQRLVRQRPPQQR